VCVFIKISNMGLYMSVNVSFICRLLFVMPYIWNLSNVLSLGPFFSTCNIFIISSIVSQLCPVSRICCANLEFCLVVLMALVFYK
jgi:hypothetical protein